MLHTFKEFLKTIFYGKSAVENSDAVTTQELTGGNSASKPEEHLVLLNNKARTNDGPDTTVTEGLSGDLSTQDIPKSTPDKNKREYVKLESDEEWNEFFAFLLPIPQTKNLFLRRKGKLSITAKRL